MEERLNKQLTKETVKLLFNTLLIQFAKSEIKHSSNAIEQGKRVSIAKLVMSKIQTIYQSNCFVNNNICIFNIIYYNVTTETRFISFFKTFYPKVS